VTRFVAAGDALAGGRPPGRGAFLARIVDRGAITASFVGIGMAVVIGISFLLVIPIEPVYWAFSVPGGLLIGYYADARSGRRRGEWRRIVGNALFAGAATGLTLAVLLLTVKALFFVADDGYRDPALGDRIACTPGADCVYRRYLEVQAPALAAAGVTDASSFSTFYWSQQATTAELLVFVSAIAGLGGGAIFGLTRPGPRTPRATLAA
jgi:hypothetical protein